MKNVVLQRFGASPPWFTCGSISEVPTISRFGFHFLRVSICRSGVPWLCHAREGVWATEGTDLQPVLFLAPPLRPLQQSDVLACLGFSGGSVLTSLTSPPSDPCHHFFKCCLLWRPISIGFPAAPSLSLSALTPFSLFWWNSVALILFLLCVWLGGRVGSSLWRRAKGQKYSPCHECVSLICFCLLWTHWIGLIQTQESYKRSFSINHLKSLWSLLPIITYNPGSLFQQGIDRYDHYSSSFSHTCNSYLYTC